MKKKLLLSTAALSLALMSAGIGAYAATKFTLVVNGKVANVEPKVIDGTTYIPVRAAAELLGAEVGYDAVTRTVTVKSKESSGSTSSGSSQASTKKMYPVNVKVQSGPMVLTISKVTLDLAYKQYSYEQASHNAIVLDATVENTSDQKLSWYVDQSTAVLNTKEQIERTLMSDNRISADFNGKVTKKGQIVFEVKNGPLDDISDIRLLLSYVVDKDFKTIAEETEATIVIK